MVEKRGQGTRASGVLLHVTSLPGDFGSGDFGREAYRFVDWLHEARQGLWQVLPLVPPGYGESPYQGYSAFAGNALLISLELLREEPWFRGGSREALESDITDRVDFEQVIPFRLSALREAFAIFQEESSEGDREKVETFRETNRWWLEDYALFMALKEHFDGKVWNRWPGPLVQRKEEALKEARQQLQEEVNFHVFLQYQFCRQWQRLKDFANERGIRIIGDIPIFVAHDSADVWSNQELFHLDENGNPTVVAGVPPDYFSATGQRWGNPLYRWEAMQENDYHWWMSRFARSAIVFDYTRLDHFRGFEAYWEISADSPDAVQGVWISGPGIPFFQAMQNRLGKLKIIAEDLGVITPEVQALRDRFDFPGMRVVQFGFGEDPLKALHQPHNFIRNCVAYSGTHDNDTTVGWFQSQEGEGTTRTAEEINRERQEFLRYLGGNADEIHWRMIRLVQASVARFSVVTMQDVLGLGSEARMNLPGSSQGNWRWRMRADELCKEDGARLREMAEAYDRRLFIQKKAVKEEMNLSRELRIFPGP